MVTSLDVMARLPRMQFRWGLLLATFGGGSGQLCGSRSLSQRGGYRLH